jgi:hypothetical protein
LAELWACSGELLLMAENLKRAVLLKQRERKNTVIKSDDA